MSDALSGPIMTRVVRFFEDDDWNVQQVGERPSLSSLYQGKNVKVRILATGDEASGIVRFYAVYDFNVPEQKRSEIAEFITRANYGMNIGNFEMDFSDGELRYKASIDVEDSIESLTFLVIKRMVYAGAISADRYHPGVMAVIYGGQSAAAAVQSVEGG